MIRSKEKDVRDDWQPLFKQRLFPVSLADLDIEGAMALKHANIPAALYRYRADPKRYLDELRNQHAFFSSPSQFNDPYDSGPSLAMRDVRLALPSPDIRELVKQLGLEEVFSCEQIDDICAREDRLMEFLGRIPAANLGVTEMQARQVVDVVREIFEKNEKEIVEAFNQGLQRGMKVCCFSERRDSIVMWGHYANNHSGIVIEYAFRAVGPREALVRSLMPVFYDRRFFDGTPYLVQHARHGEFNNLFSQSAAMHKAPDWAYEREWRVVYPIGDDSSGGLYPLPPISAVYLGARTPDAEKRCVVEAANELGISVYQTSLSTTDFELEFHPWNDD